MATVAGERLGWQGTLESLKFRRAKGASYKRDGFVARPSSSWFSLERGAAGRLDPLGNSRQRPGLWKLVGGAKEESARWEFHLPLAALGPQTSLDEDGEDPLRAGIQWALATADGRLPSGWEPPARSEVDSWIADGGLSVQTGPFARQGALEHDRGRLALAFALAEEVPPQLSPARRGWLRAVLLNAQDRWHMVRFGMDEAAGSSAVEARIDLSGAPHTILEELFKVSLDALRLVVTRLIWPVGFLADPDVRCEAWESCRNDTFSKGKEGCDDD